MKKVLLCVGMLFLMMTMVSASTLESSRTYCYYCENGTLDFIKVDGTECPEGYSKENIACKSIEANQTVKPLTGKTIAEPAKEELSTWKEIIEPFKLFWEKLMETIWER